MKNAIYHILAFAFLLTAGTACNDDTFTGNAGDGRTVTIRQLTLETGKEDRKDMALTKAKELLSTVNNVTLFIFDESGKMEDYGDLNENSQITETGTTAEGCRIYKLSGGGLEATTGKKTIYAIANHDAPFWQSCLDELKNLQLTEDEFQKKLFTINADLISSQALPGFETDYVLLTGKGTDITVQDDGTAAGTIYVKRPVAQINVRIHTHTDKGGEDRDHTIEFTPSTYTVYNVPQQCMVFNNEGTVPADGTREYYNIRTQNAREAEDDGISYITFYMPENPQPQGNEAIGNDYHKRDKWEDLQNGSKHWTYAPQNSTYMVIEGDYIETDQNGMLIYQGKVSYTIHLGDFSANTGSMRDFSVKRNVRYTYNIKVMGVESIIAEATTDEEKESGAEGNIIGTESAAQIFELDCHYEQVFVSYNLSDIADSLNCSTDDDDISQSFMLWASTPFSKSPEILLPYTDDRTEEEATKDMDCKWVSFLPQKEANVLSPYPGLPENDPDTELVTPYRLCKSLGTVVKKILNHEYIPTDNKVEGIWIQQDMNGDYYAYFTVFIDEYYYDKNPISGEPVAWGDFTRQNDRTMIIASDIQSSTDGNSTYSKARTSFTQKAIQTFYNADADETVNAMGVETYCENYPFSFFSIRDAYSTSLGTSPSNGRKNIIELLSLNYNTPKWNVYVNTEKNGYYGTDAAKDSRSHKIANNDMLREQPYYDYVKNEEIFSLHPYYACLSRNRDLNGNGNIDNSEIRWYLAAADQYLRIGIGSDAMSDASKLFMEDKSLIPGQTYPDNFFDDGALYYTSTNYDSQRGKNKRLIWAAEIAAFGDYDNEKYKMLIRCVRNLPSGQTVGQSPDETVTDNSYYYDPSRRLFSFGDILDPLVFREVQYNGAYGQHFEEPNSTLPSTANRLYHGGFVVADKDVSVNAYNGSLATMKSIWEGTENPCAKHTDNNDQAHQGAWRVPNLRETLIMSTQPGLFANGNYYYMTSTSFSGRGGTSSYEQRPGFAYDAAGKKITAQPNGEYAIRVRCVRDADPDETYP